MSLNKKIVEKNTDIAYRIIEGKALIIKSSTRRAYTLNETGTAIWELIDNKRRVEDLIEKLQKEFNVAKYKAEEDVIEFIKELSRQRVVTLKDK